MTTFNSELADSMKSYHEGVAAILAEKNDTTEEEQAAALERNSHSQKLGEDGYAAAEERGN